VPIYEYECNKCGHFLEVIQKISDDALTKCPACHAPELQKRVSAAAFHLKGNGWYVTDFKDKPKPVTEDNKKDHNGKNADSTAKTTDKTGTKTAASETSPNPQKTEPASSD
jgi:putative FmdB family regulatory protein